MPQRASGAQDLFLNKWALSPQNDVDHPATHRSNAMHSITARLGIAAAVAAQLLALSSAAEARFGRGAAFVGGVAAGAVVAGAATAPARYGYYYGAPVVVAPPPRPACGYYPYPPCY
jgi:hypothetical protein